MKPVLMTLAGGLATGLASLSVAPAAAELTNRDYLIQAYEMEYAFQGAALHDPDIAAGYAPYFQCLADVVIATLNESDLATYTYIKYKLAEIDEARSRLVLSDKERAELYAEKLSEARITPNYLEWFEETEAAIESTGELDNCP